MKKTTQMCNDCKVLLALRVLLTEIYDGVVFATPNYEKIECLIDAEVINAASAAAEYQELAN